MCYGFHLALDGLDAAEVGEVPSCRLHDLGRLQEPYARGGRSLVDRGDAALRVPGTRVCLWIVEGAPGQHSGAVVPDWVGNVSQVDEKAIGPQVESSNSGWICRGLLYVCWVGDFIQV